MSSVLDGPPPSPVLGQAAPMTPGGGMGAAPTFAQMAAPLTAGTPGRAVTPEIAIGLMQSGETIAGMLDTMASIAPDLANDFALQKDLLQRTLAKLFLASGQPSAPANPGMQFPGGGFASGTP